MRQQILHLGLGDLVRWHGVDALANQRGGLIVGVCSDEAENPRRAFVPRAIPPVANRAACSEAARSRTAGRLLRRDAERKRKKAPKEFPHSRIDYITGICYCFEKRNTSKMKRPFRSGILANTSRRYPAAAAMPWSFS